MKNIELHMHPFLERYKISDVVKAMDKTGLDVVGMVSLDNSIFPYILSESKRIYPNAKADDFGVRIDGKYLLNAREYNTKENLQVLTIGYSMDCSPETDLRRIIDSGLENNSLVLLDHPFADNGKTKTAGHIPESLAQDLENICKEYSGEVCLEWNGYCIPWVRKFLRHGLNSFGFNIKYHDVNKKTEELSNSLKEEGYNVPVVTDTDLHARRKRHLQYIGKSRITAPLLGEDPGELVHSLCEKIFEGNYENNKKFVSYPVMLRTLGAPLILSDYVQKPRG